LNEFTPRIRPSATWRDADTHYLKALQDDWFRSVLALNDCMTRATVDFWRARGVLNGFLPVTTGSISSPTGLGSDSQPVVISMFGQQTYLADSMQFGLEYLCRLNPGGAYYLMPSFRGESSDPTHLCQFFHSEAEIPGGLDEVLEVVEIYLRYVVARFRAELGEQISAAAGGLGHLDRFVDPRPFERIEFDEAVVLLGNDPTLVSTDTGLGWRGLTRLGEQRLMELRGQFIWLTHFDELAVPFYQAVDGRSRALNGDLLFGPGEVVGAGERNVDGSTTLAALERHGVRARDYEWYVTMKDVAPLRTAGFGLGVERFFMWLMRHDDIRDFQLFVRENGVTILP
jgi:asparaginyl-tRNA synthetase